MQKATFSGLPLKTVRWPTYDSRPLFFDGSIHDILATLRRKSFKVGKNDPVRATLITTVPRLRRLLEKVGLEAPQQLTVGRVLDVMSCDKHCVVNKHVMVAGRCGRSTCLLCDRTYQDTSDVATLLLGAKDRVPRLRSMLEPVVDTTNHAHYVSSTSRIGTYEAISGSRSGIEPCPSILVDKLALAQIKQGKRANAAVKLKLANQCCFGPSSSEHRAFLTFIDMRTDEVGSMRQNQKYNWKG